LAKRTLPDVKGGPPVLAVRSSSSLSRLFALLVSSIGVLAATEAGAQTPASSERGRSNAQERTAIGAQFSMGRLNVGMMAFGLVAAYSPRPSYAVGVEFGMVTVGPGAQSGRCANCVAGLRAGALAELRTTWPQIFHLFARVTLGSSVGERAGDGMRGIWLTQVAGGPELLIEAMYLRPFVHAGAFDWHAIWVGCGAEVGAVF
jgi:hypothetical protein